MYKNIVFLIFLKSFIFSQECEPGFIWVEDVPSCCGAPAQHCFYESDLNILQSIIDNSTESINLEMDDNEDGIIEPVELGLTEWVGGRLVALDCFLSNIMNCNLSGPLPDNFGDLEFLEALWLTGNQLSGPIPESIGNLTNLELLYLSENQFSGNIPEDMCNIDIDWGGENTWGVEYFNIHNNLLCTPYPSCMDAEIIGMQNDEACTLNIGDINGDTNLNILDIIFIANMIIEQADYQILADLNEDGSINVLDILELANIILD